MNNKVFFDNLCDYSRDILIDYFGFKTLERAYLMKINGKPVERIQHLWLRVAIGIHGENLEKVKRLFYMSNKYLHMQLQHCIMQEHQSLNYLRVIC